jgi:hypothetical protein
VLYDNIIIIEGPTAFSIDSNVNTVGPKTAKPLPLGWGSNPKYNTARRYRKIKSSLLGSGRKSTTVYYSYPCRKPYGK